MNDRSLKETVQQREIRTRPSQKDATRLMEKQYAEQTIFKKGRMKGKWFEVDA